MRMTLWGTAIVGAVVALAALIVAVVALADDDDDGGGRSVAVVGGDAAAQAGGVTVVGQGTVRVDPDRAILSIGAGVTAPRAADAWNGTQAAIGRLSDLLQSQFGIAEEDITTEFVSLFPQFDFDRPLPEGGNQSITGYRAEQTLSVRIERTDALGEIVDAASEELGDALTVSGVSFTVDDPSQFEGPAREAAVENARVAAGDIAELAEVDLGDPIAIEQLSLATSAPIEAADRAAFQPAGLGFFPGQAEIVVVLKVTFAIR